MRTNAGTDLVADCIGKRSSQPAPADYMAVTANATAVSASDTSLTAEITTGGGGLIRKQATYAHTGGTSTYTQTATFTANGSDTVPVILAKYGLLNASSSGTLGWSTVFSATATIAASGDALTITFTGTVS